MIPLLLLLAAAPIRAVPAGPTRRWFTPADYPIDALLAQQEGVVGFELAIGRDGRPGRCRIYRSSGKPLLDEATCKLAAQRARFKPLRSKAVRSKAPARRGRPRRVVKLHRTFPMVYRHTVRWRLPKGGTSSQAFVVRSTVRPDGTIAVCNVSGPGAGGGLLTCGRFGDATFLAGLLGEAAWRRTGRAEVRFDLALASSTKPPVPRGSPDAYQLLGEASVGFSPAGRLVRCIGLRDVQSAGRSTDICDLLRAQPPFIGPGGERRGVYTLDVSAYFR